MISHPPPYIKLLTENVEGERRREKEKLTEGKGKERKRKGKGKRKKRGRGNGRQISRGRRSRICLKKVLSATYQGP